MYHLLSAVLVVPPEDSPSCSTPKGIPWKSSVASNKLATFAPAFLDRDQFVSPAKLLELA